MPSNEFLNPNGTTTLIVTSDHAIEGMGRYGRPYKAYPVQTETGRQDMFFPSARVLDQLSGREVRRGTRMEISGRPAVTRDGKPYTRYELVSLGTGDAPAHTSPRDDGNLQMLRCVALKAAAATRGISGEPPEVIGAANAYLDWLTRP